MGEYGVQRRRWPSRPSRSQAAGGRSQAAGGFEFERTGRRLPLPEREIRQEGLAAGRAGADIGGGHQLSAEYLDAADGEVAERLGGAPSSKPQVRAWVRQLVRWSRPPRWTSDADPSTSRWIDFVPQKVREGGTITTHALIARA
ncbi:hypothetical protein NE236_29910 [Actinoallomurus purpureus]|uniref:hypothetical protein n=1 Tax=Actinoallomurus purpureus TaxID=478114 RepID=UPI002092E6F6|nr:hypothetical protein [Actinoallomurus purpureus]MCO6009193.1 hypothetical protein [Actinoallomurus purpureus]